MSHFYVHRSYCLTRNLSSVLRYFSRSLPSVDQKNLCRYMWTDAAIDGHPAPWDVVWLPHLVHHNFSVSVQKSTMVVVQQQHRKLVLPWEDYWELRFFVNVRSREDGSSRIWHNWWSALLLLKGICFGFDWLCFRTIITSGKHSYCVSRISRFLAFWSSSDDSGPTNHSNRAIFHLRFPTKW